MSRSTTIGKTSRIGKEIRKVAAELIDAQQQESQHQEIKRLEELVEVLKQLHKVI